MLSGSFKEEPVGMKKKEFAEQKREKKVREFMSS